MVFGCVPFSVTVVRDANSSMIIYMGHMSFVRGKGDGNRQNKVSEGKKHFLISELGLL